MDQVSQSTDRFIGDLTWLSGRVVEASKRLTPDKTHSFRLDAIHSIFALWDEGKAEGRLDDLYIPRMIFDENNEGFQVTFGFASEPVEATIKIYVRRRHGVWGVECLR